MSDPDAFAGAMRIADAFEHANIPYAVGDELVKTFSLAPA